MRHAAILMTTLALTLSGLVVSPAHSAVPVNGDYVCTTGLLKTTQTSNLYTITGGVVSGHDSGQCAGVIVIPQGVTEISQLAFGNQSLSLSITIPSSVTEISPLAFVSSTGLTSIAVDSTNPNFSATSGVLFNKTVTTLISYPAGQSNNTYTIPSSVTRIGDYAFADVYALSALTIPTSVTSIGQYAFDGSTSPTSITIPSSVTNIGTSAFRNTTRLTDITVDSANPNYSDSSGVLFNKTATALIAYPAGKSGNSFTIPSSVTSIEESAFTQTRLTNVTIPSSVTSIGPQAFENSTSLTSITIPSSVTRIGYAAFWGVSSLTNITIPSSVTSIGQYAFNYTASLSSITIDSANPNYSSTSGVLFNKAATTLISYPAGKSDISYNIPSSVIAVTEGAFTRTNSLTSITFPSSIELMGIHVFSGIAPITSFTFLGNAPTTVGMGPFEQLAIGATAYIKSGATGFGGAGANWNGLIVEIVVDPPAPAPVSNSAPAPVSNSAPAIETPVQVVDTGLAARTVSAKKKYSGKSLAKQIGIKMISPKATVSISAAKSSKKICTKSSARLRTLKAGNCVVTFTVQEPKPKKGKKPKATKTTTTLVVR